MSYAELMGFKQNFGFYDGPQGMPCNLTIITLPGATVTITLGAETHTATANADGRASFTIGNAGLWSVVSVKDDVTQVGTVQVENVVTKALALPAPLESLTWSEISAISRAGLAAQNFNIGDTKTFRLSTGEEIIAEIIGFDHDDIDDGSVATYGRTKAGITFQCKKSITAANRMAAGNNAWDTCEMRLVTLPNIKGQMPQALSGKIANVKKYTSLTFAATSGIGTTIDNLFVLSRIEVDGTAGQHAGEGEQYEFYASGRSKQKFNAAGAAIAWWTRSPFISGSTGYYYGINSSGVVASYTPTNTTVSNLFAFCI